MSVTGTREITIILTGDVEFNQEFDSVQNTLAPGEILLADLASGSNTIMVPTGSTGATIIPPDGNTQTITLKGVTGDTGVAIHPSDPTSLGLNNVSSFDLTAGGTINALRVIFS